MQDCGIVNASALDNTVLHSLVINMIVLQNDTYFGGIILCMCPANERRM